MITFESVTKKYADSAIAVDELSIEFATGRKGRGCRTGARISSAVGRPSSAATEGLLSVGKTHHQVPRLLRDPATIGIAGARDEFDSAPLE